MRASSSTSTVDYWQFTKGPSVPAQIGWSMGHAARAQEQSNVFFGQGIGLQPTAMEFGPMPTRTQTCVAGSQFTAPHGIGIVLGQLLLVLTFQCPVLLQKANCSGPAVGQLP